MKVSRHRAEWLRSPSPRCHSTETLREGTAVQHGRLQHPSGTNLPDVRAARDAAHQQRGRGRGFISQLCFPWWVFRQLRTGPCWIPQGLQHFGRADLSCLPLNINSSIMAKRGPLDVHILCTLVGCSVVVLHSGARAETSLPQS